MAWPANSTDLNPIEHAWDALGRTIEICQLPPRTIQELKIAVVEEQEGLPQALLNSLINSMYTRCACGLSGGLCTILEATHTVLASLLLSSFILKFRQHWIYWQMVLPGNFTLIFFLFTLLSWNKLYPYKISFSYIQYFLRYLGKCLPSLNFVHQCTF